MSYVYRRITSPNGAKYFAVGYHRPADDSGAGGWYEESKHENAEDAAWRVHFLNGGSAERSPAEKICLQGPSR